MHKKLKITLAEIFAVVISLTSIVILVLGILWVCFATTKTTCDAMCCAPPMERHLLACGTGCLAPWDAPVDATLSYPVLVNVSFSASYVNYAGASNGYSLAYGICYAIGCNYRNVTVSLVTADVVAKQQAIYSVVFATPPGTNAQVLPYALKAALPSIDTTIQNSIAYGVTFTQGGSISTFTGMSHYTGTVDPAATNWPPMVPMPPTPPPAPASQDSCFNQCVAPNVWLC